MPASVLSPPGAGQLTLVMPSAPLSAKEQKQQTAATSRGPKNGPQIVTFALQKRPRATRASVPKVRTGCITCKKRHVKCDEAKPFCQRCIKWQGWCEGYDSTTGSSASSPTRSEPAKSKPKAAAPRPCKRKPKACPTSESQSHDSPADQKWRLLVEPYEQLFEDELEKRYFFAWTTTKNPPGGVFSDDTLWSQTIPQLSREHSSVRYAITAIGAMKRAVSKGFRAAAPAELAANGPDYGLALSYYGRAIRGVSRANLDPANLRAAVVCCLLFVCFEVLHGDCRSAFAHFDNGQRMMEDILGRQGDEDVDPSVLGAQDLERDMLSVFQRLIQQSWSRGILRSPEVDARRTQSRSRADATTDDNGRRNTSDEVPKPRAWCCRGGARHKAVVEKMPSTFADLTAARRWWDVTQHHITHSSDIVFRITQQGLDDTLVGECKGRVSDHLARIELLRAGVLPKPSAKSRHFIACLERWHDSFLSLWENAERNKDGGNESDSRAYMQAVHLRIQYLNLYTCLQAPLSCDYDTIVQMTPTFRRIVHLSSLLLAHQKAAAAAAAEESETEVFTMDASPTYPLFLAGMRCRDFQVREEAIRLLAAHPRRDGFWDSRMYLALAGRNRMLEILNARDGSAEEQWWRLQSRTAFLDEEGKLKARAMAKNPSTGNWESGEDYLGQFLHV